MEIKVLGTGCKKCKTLEEVTKKAVEEAGIDATIIKVEDVLEIMKLGVLTTPALVIDGEIALKGKVPSIEEIKNLLSK